MKYMYWIILDMGDWMYTAVVRSTAERDAFIRYVQEQA